MKWKNEVLTIVILASLFAAFVWLGEQIINRLMFQKFKYVNDSNKVQRYLDWITPIAKTVGPKYGIPWQAIVVQTALETGWGKSSLLQQHNNFGGIKYAGSGAPSKVNYPTKEFTTGGYVTINSWFASWPTPMEGLSGYANFFHRNARYRAALQYPHNASRFIEEIWKAGYATDPNYVSKLTGMIKSYNLA